MKEFGNRILQSTDDVEKLIKVKNKPELSDSYFLHMRMIDLKKLEKKYSKLEKEFKELEEWVDEQSQMLTEERVKKELNLFGSSQSSQGLSQVHDENYEELMLRFVQDNLTFKCPKCKKEIPFGEERCYNCDHKMDWWYDPDETLQRLKKSPKSEFSCPNDGCGAMIHLDWPNCAFCGLDIQKMLETMIFFD